MTSPKDSRLAPAAGSAPVAPSAGPPSDAGPPSFEQSMERLSHIVKKLEDGELPLEQSLALFEEGVRLSRLAQQRLDSAQQRIERLLTVDAQGRPRTAPFETTADSGEDAPPF